MSIHMNISHSCSVIIKLLTEQMFRPILFVCKISWLANMTHQFL